MAHTVLLDWSVVPVAAEAITQQVLRVRLGKEMQGETVLINIMAVAEVAEVPVRSVQLVPVRVAEMVVMLHRAQYLAHL